MKPFFLCCLVLLAAACDLHEGSDREAMDAAGEWADAYFNADYHAAEALSTPESRRFLAFAASNTTQHDLDLLKETPAEVAVDDILEANDTLRVVTLKVNHYLQPTLLGQSARQQEEGEFHVTVVKRDTRWLVKMEGLPRSERQSRD